MLKSQFNFLCNTFGKSNLPDSEKWRCVKYIYIENPIVDVQKLIKRGEILYVDNSGIGPGFYILSYTNSDLGVPKFNERVVTFIPLSLIDKISIIPSLGDSDDDDMGEDDENNILYVDTNGDILILHDKDIEVETYEDIIIINNVVAETEDDALIIKKS